MPSGGARVGAGRKPLPRDEHGRIVRPQPLPDGAGLLSVKEFAARARLDASTIYRLAKSGRLPGVVRVGRSIRIDPRVSLESVNA